MFIQANIHPCRLLHGLQKNFKMYAVQNENENIVKSNHNITSLLITQSF